MASSPNADSILKPVRIGHTGARRTLRPLQVGSALMVSDEAFARHSPVTLGSKRSETHTQTGAHLVEDPDNELLFSAASLWEITCAEGARLRRSTTAARIFSNPLGKYLGPSQAIAAALLPPWGRRYR